MKKYALILAFAILPARVVLANPGSFLTTPRSATGTVQYNENGLFKGTTEFTYSTQTKTLTAPKFSGDGSGLTGISGAGGGTTLGQRTVFSTNAVTNSNGGDTPHPFIISTNTLQVGTTFYTSSGTIAGVSGLTVFTVERGTSSFDSVTSSAIYMKIGAEIYAATSDVNSGGYGFIGNPSVGMFYGGNNLAFWQGGSAMSFNAGVLTVSQLSANNAGSLSSPNYSLGFNGGLINRNGSNDFQLGYNGVEKIRMSGATNGVSFGAIPSNGAGVRVGTECVNCDIFTVSSETNKFQVRKDSSSFYNDFYSSSDTYLLNLKNQSTIGTDSSGKIVAGTGGGGAGDNLGSHVATTTVQMNGYAIIGSSKIAIGNTTSQYALSVTSIQGNGSLVEITTGTTRLFEADGTSATLNWSTLNIGSGTVKNDAQLLSKLGNINNPSYSFYASKNTGMYGTGGSSPQIKFTVNGTDHFILDSSNPNIQFYEPLSAASALNSVTLPPYGFVDSDVGMTNLKFNNHNLALVNNTGTTRAKLVLDSAGSVVIGMLEGTRASFTVSSGARSNVAIMDVSSGPASKLYVTGTSVTINTTLIIAPSTGNAFVTSPSSWAVIVTTWTKVDPSIPAVGVSTTGYLIFGSSAVVVHAISGCGSTPNPTIYGGGNAFAITPGGSASGCTITFGTPFTNPPIVMISQRTGDTANALSYTVTNTALTITKAGLNSVLDIILAPPTP